MKTPNPILEKQLRQYQNKTIYATYKLNMQAEGDGKRTHNGVWFTWSSM